MEEQKIYIIPTTISEHVTDVIPKAVEDILLNVKYIVSERARTTRRYIKELLPNIQISELTILEIDKHKPKESLPEFKEWLAKGFDIGIMSESGMPCIADPGNIFVALAHQQNKRVIPLTGPCSIMLALAASGLNGQKFKFHGYLPLKDEPLNNKLKMIKGDLKNGETQIFIETPFRNKRIFDQLIRQIPKHIKLTIGMDLTGSEEFVKTKTIEQWKKNKPELQKLPCIFLLGN